MMDDRELNEQIQKLIDASFALLSYRPRSEHEIREYAKRKKYPEEAVSSAIERLKDLGYLNDLEFARWWVGSRSGRKAKGNLAIMSELFRKGIAREVILKAVEESRTEPGSDEKDIARRVLEKKYPDTKSMDKRKRFAYLYAFLLRRGFTPETARSLIDEYRRKDYNTPQDDGIGE